MATLKSELVQHSTLHPATALLQSVEMLTLYYFLSLQLWLAARILAQRSFTSACLDPDLSIVSADEITVYNRLAVNVLTRTQVEEFGTFWATHVPGHFIGDLNCIAFIGGIELVNTHHAHWRNAATKGFTVSFSMTSAGPWTEAVSGELEDSRQQQDPLPLQTFSFSGVYARFVKFEITSCYDVWGGLQYFNVLNVLVGMLEEHSRQYMLKSDKKSENYRSD